MRDLDVMSAIKGPHIVRRFAPLVMQWGVTAYSAAVSLGLSVLFARSMGSTAFGHYTYIYVLASFLVLAQDAGFNTLLMRERSAPSATLSAHWNQLPTVALIHLCFTTLLFMVVAALLWDWLDAPSLLAAIFCFAAITLSQWQSSWFKGAGFFARDAVFMFCGRSASALFVLVSVMTFGASPRSIFLAWGAGLLLTLLCHHRYFPSFSRIDYKLPGWAYCSSISFFAVGLASTLYHQIDIVILRNLLGEVPAIGHYAVATRIHDGLLSLATPVMLMLFRRMRVLALQPGVNNRFSRGSVGGALVVGLVLALMGWIFGPWMVGLLFGHSYAEGAQTIIRLLFIALIFALPNYVLEQTAIATHHERLFAVSLMLAVCINVALNLYLVPLIGVVGAAWATIITEITLSVALIWGLRGKLFN